MALAFHLFFDLLNCKFAIGQQGNNKIRLIIDCDLLHGCHMTVLHYIKYSYKMLSRTLYENNTKKYKKIIACRVDLCRREQSLLIVIFVEYRKNKGSSILENPIDVKSMCTPISYFTHEQSPSVCRVFRYWTYITRFNCVLKEFLLFIFHSYALSPSLRHE